ARADRIARRARGAAIGHDMAATAIAAAAHTGSPPAVAGTLSSTISRAFARIGGAARGIAAAIPRSICRARPPAVAGAFESEIDRTLLRRTVRAAASTANVPLYSGPLAT